jgi:hypothetical protein
MNKFSKYASIAMVAVLLLGMFYVLTPRAYAIVNMTLVNANVAPDIGTGFFNLTGKAVGDTFKVNLTVVNVVDLASWQGRVSWDPAKLSFVSFVFPSDDVFAALSPIRAPTDSSVAGTVLAGAAAGPGAGTFTGTGTLGVLTLSVLFDPPTTGVISYTALGSDTFLLDGVGNDIAFTPVSADYAALLPPPPASPSFYLLPATISPPGMDSVFGVDVMVSGVSSLSKIIAFQFSIMWNTTLIEPTTPFFANGTFLETFQYQADGVLYAEDIDAHFRPPPATALPAGINYSTVGALLMPDAIANNTYHAPFPSGAGKLCTLYFKVILTTVAPEQIISSIDFINFKEGEDFLVLDSVGSDLGITSATGAVYKAPQTVLGLSIDVYTQYPFGYGGQGGNMTSDSFGPQEQVDLYALVTYNAYPVQQKLVGFQIYHQGLTQGYNFAREATTDADGISHIAFRLPWPCNDPVNEIFGWWYVNATVEVAQQTVVDNLKFWVWWPVEVVSIEPKFTSVNQTKQGCTMDFEMVYRRFDALPKDVLLTATVYDELGFFIGSAFKYDTVANDPVAYDAFGNPIPAVYTWDFTISIPSNAVVGKCIIYGNAFTTWPWLGGYPYCPEVHNTIDFRISKP